MIQGLSYRYPIQTISHSDGPCSGRGFLPKFVSLDESRIMSDTESGCPSTEKSGRRTSPIFPSLRWSTGFEAGPELCRSCCDAGWRDREGARVLRSVTTSWSETGASPTADHPFHKLTGTLSAVLHATRLNTDMTTSGNDKSLREKTQVDLFPPEIVTHIVQCFADKLMSEQQYYPPRAELAPPSTAELLGLRLVCQEWSDIVMSISFETVCVETWNQAKKLLNHPRLLSSESTTLKTYPVRHLILRDIWQDLYAY